MWGRWCGRMWLNISVFARIERMLWFCFFCSCSGARCGAGLALLGIDVLVWSAGDGFVVLMQRHKFELLFLVEQAGKALNLLLEALYLVALVGNTGLHLLVEFLLKVCFCR